MLDFINTPNSIAAEDSKDKAKTGSPWIYSELLMATEFPHRTWASYRETLQHGLRKDDKMLEFAQELKVKYEAPIEELNDLSFSDLQPDKLGKRLSIRFIRWTLCIRTKELLYKDAHYGK